MGTQPTTARLASAGEAIEPLPLLITKERAMQELGGISLAKLNEMIARGQIGSCKIGTRRLIPRASLLAFVASLMSGAA